MQVRPRREGVLGVFTGASRQGKTYQVKKRIKKERRVVVWSVKETIDRYADTWPDSIVVRGSIHDLDRVLFGQIGAKAGRVVYVPRSLKDFGAFSALAHSWGVVKECAAVFEEVADVTTPAKAPEGYGNLLRQGLGWGINIYVVTQRPAESDKTAMGNATYFHVHYMAREKDRRYMAEEMNISPGDIAALKKYQWIERWGNGKLIKG